MTIKITKLIIKDAINKKTKKKLSKPGFFEIDLEFEIKNKKSKNPDCFDNLHVFFEELLDFHRISYLEDPKTYMDEIRLSIKNNPDDFAKACNTPTTQTWKSGYAHGYDIMKRKGDKYFFNEYFTYTPVTRGILTELKKMKKDPKYSKKTIPEQYLGHLLKSLSYFWD